MLPPTGTINNSDVCLVHQDVSAVSLVTNAPAANPVSTWISHHHFAFRTVEMEKDSPSIAMMATTSMEMDAAMIVK